MIARGMPRTLVNGTIWRLTTCTVKESVARLDGVIDSIGAGIIVDFPKSGRGSACFLKQLKDGYSPKANKGHLVAAVELDSGRSHAGVCERSDSDSLKED